MQRTRDVRFNSDWFVYCSGHRVHAEASVNRKYRMPIWPAFDKSGDKAPDRRFEFTSAKGQKRRFDPLSITSGLPRSTDIFRAGRHVSNAPRRDSCIAASVVQLATHAQNLVR